MAFTRRCRLIFRMSVVSVFLTLLHKVEMRGDMANQCKHHSFLPYSPKYHYRATHSAGAHAYQVVEVATNSKGDGVTENMRNFYL